MNKRNKTMMRTVYGTKVVKNTKPCDNKSTKNTARNANVMLGLHQQHESLTQTKVKSLPLTSTPGETKASVFFQETIETVQDARIQVKSNLLTPSLFLSRGRNNNVKVIHSKSQEELVVQNEL